MTRPLGLKTDLYLLPFDHRSSFEKDLFGIVGRSPTPREKSEISHYKRMIYEGFRLAVENGIPKANAGILVDEQFGAEILKDARQLGYLTACSVEKSGQKEFDFEYGDDFKEHILRTKPNFVKALVRYNLEGDLALNERQTQRLRLLSDFCHQNGLRFIFELLVPATQDQMHILKGDGKRYERELRPALIVNSIQEIQRRGIEPDVWKVEGVDTSIEYVRIAEKARSTGRGDVAVILLGGGEDKGTLKHRLMLASQVAGYRGFAIGRTVWEEALKMLRLDQISQQAAVEKIAFEYSLFCRIWIDAEVPGNQRKIS